LLLERPPERISCSTSLPFQISIRGIVEKIISVLKSVHSEAVFDQTTYVFDMIRKYTKWARERKAFFPHDFDWMCNVADRIEKAMDRDKPELADCRWPPYYPVKIGIPAQ